MRRRIILLPLLAMLAPGAAQACAIVVSHQPSPTQERAAARRAVDEAVAIIDGEVIRPFVRDGAPALVRVHRLFKGPQQAEFEVGERGSCDVALTEMGERSRMILTGGPDVYFIQIDTTNTRIVDRLLGSDRRRDWPYVQGTEATP